jgi:hypothetical protein
LAKNARGEEEPIEADREARRRANRGRAVRRERLADGLVEIVVEPRGGLDVDDVERRSVYRFGVWIPNVARGQEERREG